MSDPTDTFEDVLRALVANDFGTAAARIDAFLATMPDDASPALRAQARRVAATAHRLAGHLDVAREHVRAALAQAPDPITRIEAELEAGDLARTIGDLDASVAAYERAAAVAAKGDVPEPVRWQVELRVTLGLAVRGDVEAATSRFTDLAAKLPDVSPELLDQLVPPAQAALARALTHLADGAMELTAEALDVAEREARKAEDVPSYVAAKLAKAQILEEGGDRVAAYGTLATGWATLRAGVDKEIARAGFEPAMLDLVERWGEEAFEAVKVEFEQSLTGNGGPS